MTTDYAIGPGKIEVGDIRDMPTTRASPKHQGQPKAQYVRPLYRVVGGQKLQVEGFAITPPLPSDKASRNLYQGKGFRIATPADIEQYGAPRDPEPNYETTAPTPSVPPGVAAQGVAMSQADVDELARFRARKQRNKERIAALKVKKARRQ